jgi:putative FmdB family regulatory protein
MPIYDFKCDKCGVIEEHLVKNVNSCPDKCSCGKSKKLTKVETFSSSKPILKVNGFYETDYKNK